MSFLILALKKNQLLTFSFFENHLYIGGYDPNDSEPPKIINCPNATRIVSIDVPQSGYEIIWQVPSAVDNSGFPVEVTSSHQPGDQLQLGTTTITYEFTDVVGNSASCSFKINIVGMIYEGSGAGGGTR